MKKLSSNQASIQWLCYIGTLEGISYLLLLLIAMPLKYWADMPVAVSVVGMAHGLLFLAYVGYGFYLTLRNDWHWGWFAAIFIASLLPCGPFVVDRKVQQRFGSA